MEFEDARKKVYRQYNGKIPLGDLVDVMIEASYENLIDVIVAKFILEGKLQGPITTLKLPKDKIREREMATAKILEIMGIDLMTVDTKHEYFVGIMKGARKTRDF